MSFACPRCQSSSTLTISQSIEFPPDSRSDEIALQLVVCSRDACGFRGVAIYEESRRGALDSDHWDHTGYRLPVGDFEVLQATISRCPDPSNAGCQCKSHQELNRLSTSGRWLPPEGIEWGSAFPIVRQ